MLKPSGFDVWGGLFGHGASLRVSAQGFKRPQCFHRLGYRALSSFGLQVGSAQAVGFLARGPGQMGHVDGWIGDWA